MVIIIFSDNSIRNNILDNCHCYHPAIALSMNKQRRDKITLDAETSMHLNDHSLNDKRNK